ncbi:MAG TPA: 50S ribosomal protein L13 [Candidatus Aminicenantes bacterium]|nr:50S ribosomal protein L13 [Candidatus Aminicenantes bacterium]
MKLNRNNVTHVPKKDSLQRKWWIVDASDAVLGRLATRLSDVLRGKDHAHYTPFFDGGDFVIVINARKIRLTGQKEEQKVYYRHSGYMGGIREIQYNRLKEQHPERIVLSAVKGMLPKNRLGRKLLTKLRVYPGETHRHDAQKPEVLKV